MRPIATLLIGASLLVGCATQHSFETLERPSALADAALEAGIRDAGEMHPLDPARVSRLHYLEHLNNLKVTLDLLRIEASLGELTPREAAPIEEMFEAAYEAIERHARFPGSATDEGHILYAPDGTDVASTVEDLEQALSRAG